MSKIKIDKVVSVLPSPLVANTIYAVRVGDGFDIYISDSTGTTAHSLNINNYVNTQTDESTFDTNRTFYNQFESGVNWIIKKSVMDANGDVTNTRATGVNDASTAWTNRLTLTYS